MSSINDGAREELAANETQILLAADVFDFGELMAGESPRGSGSFHAEAAQNTIDVTVSIYNVLDGSTDTFTLD